MRLGKSSRAVIGVLAVAGAAYAAWKLTRPAATLASLPGPAGSSSNVYSQPHYGLYFVGANDVEAKAVPGQPNPYFDPTKPTLIYVHGWSVGGVPGGWAPGFILTGYPAAPNVDLAAAWRAAGWNIGIMDWMQFSDTSFETNHMGVVPGNITYDDAQRKIWAPDDQGQLVYHLADGTALVDPAYSVTDLLVNDYIAFMAPIYRGGEVRFDGHSLGGQLEVNIAHRLYEMANVALAAGTPFNTAILPSRIAMTDLVASNCPQSYLPSTQTRQRSPLLTCLNPNTPGDWVGERLFDYMTELQAAKTPVAFEAYRCWLVNSSGIGGDQFDNLYANLAFTELKPNVGLLDFPEKHAFCFWNYLWSYAYAPPKVISTATTSTATGLNCTSFNAAVTATPPAGGPAASTATDLIRAMAKSGMHFVETAGIDGPTPGDHVYTCVGP